MKASEYNISSEKFVLIGQNRKIHDVELATKPVSYFADAFSRFKRNKGSIVASIIIILLVLFAIFGPMFSPYTVSYKDDKYAFVTPRNELFVKLGIDFWNGYDKKETTEQQFLYKIYFYNIHVYVCDCFLYIYIVVLFIERWCQQCQENGFSEQKENN